MVVLTVTVDNKEIPLYMDDKLHRQLKTKVIPNIHKKDKDWVAVVDGGEGSGKSVFSMQIAKVLDPSFNLSRVCMTPEEFTKAIIKAKKGQCVIFDEAFTGLSSRSSLAEVNRIIVSLMMEMRQKNLFVIIVMPSIFLLDKYVALWRAKGLFHVYMREGKRGRWVYFNNKKKKLLYLIGRKLYDYSKPRSKFRGRFRDQYTVNEGEYREKKTFALKKKSRLTKATVYLEQRNCLFWILHKEVGKNHTHIVKLCKKWGYSIDRSSISKIIIDKQRQILEEESLKEEEAKKDKNIEETGFSSVNQD